MLNIYFVLPGCSLTSGNVSEAGQYYNVSRCSALLSNIDQIVFLVHGFKSRPWGDSQQWNRMFYETKERILEDNTANNTAVIIVDWTKGSQMDLALFLRDLLEGALLSLTDPESSSLAPVVERVLSNLFHLGPYHQAAANTRYTGAVIARLADNINKVD